MNKKLLEQINALTLIIARENIDHNNSTKSITEMLMWKSKFHVFLIFAISSIEKISGKSEIVHVREPSCVGDKQG